MQQAAAKGLYSSTKGYWIDREATTCSGHGRKRNGCCRSPPHRHTSTHRRIDPVHTATDICLPHTKATRQHYSSNRGDRQ
eukprot:5980525-Amphidinium_carterae.1